jgi:integrase
VRLLKTWKLKAGRNDLDLVFATRTGQPLDGIAVLKFGLWPALERAGLRRVTCHSLRHSFASGLIGAGAPVTEVSPLLGHGDVAVTMSVYSHWYKDTDSDAATRYTAQLFDEFQDGNRS